MTIWPPQTARKIKKDQRFKADREPKVPAGHACAQYDAVRPRCAHLIFFCSLMRLPFFSFLTPCRRVFHLFLD